LARQRTMRDAFITITTNRRRIATTIALSDTTRSSATSISISIRGGC
jgi:hypothetical protein